MSQPGGHITSWRYHPDHAFSGFLAQHWTGVALMRSASTLEIPVWALACPSSLGLEQPSQHAPAPPDGCVPCEVFRDCALHSGLLHQTPSLCRLAHAAPGFPLCSLSGGVFVSITSPQFPSSSSTAHVHFTKCVPSLATPQLAPWPADTGSESSSRYWGDSGQTVFRVTCFLPTPPNSLTVTTLPPLSTSSVLFILIHSSGA